MQHRSNAMYRLGIHYGHFKKIFFVASFYVQIKFINVRRHVTHGDGGFASCPKNNPIIKKQYCDTVNHLLNARSIRRGR